PWRWPSPGRRTGCAATASSRRARKKKLNNVGMPPGRPGTAPWMSVKTCEFTRVGSEKPRLEVQMGLDALAPRLCAPFLSGDCVLKKMWMNLVLAVSVAVGGGAFMADSADARRLGGGSSSGFKRSMPARPAQNATPAKPAQQNAAAQPGKGANAAAAPKRSWMGPIAGLAAGLGLAALMSHLGMGAEFANFI